MEWLRGRYKKGDAIGPPPPTKQESGESRRTGMGNRTGIMGAEKEIQELEEAYETRNQMRQEIGRRNEKCNPVQDN